MSLQQVKFSDAGCIDQNFFSKIGHNIRNFDWNDRNCRFKTRPIPAPASTVFDGDSGDSYEEFEAVVEVKKNPPVIEPPKEIVKEVAVVKKEHVEVIEKKPEKVPITAAEETESDESDSEPDTKRKNRRKDKEVKKLKKQLEKSEEKVKSLEEQKQSLENQNRMKKSENDALKINLEISRWDSIR